MLVRLPLGGERSRLLDGRKAYQNVLFEAPSNLPKPLLHDEQSALWIIAFWWYG